MNTEVEDNGLRDDTSLRLLKTELQTFLRQARSQNVEGKLRCRPLSESITCAETAYLWLCEVAEDQGVLNF